MNITETVRELSLIPGVSGDEDRVREAIIQKIKNAADSVETDALGNLIVFKKGSARPRNKILFSAHMDEVGFIVTYIEDSGLLRFTSVGGIDSRVVVGKTVEVGEGGIPGVIGTKPIHLQDEKEKEEAPPLDKLYIDIGAKDKAEAEKYVLPGDRAVFHSGFSSFGDGNMMCKALDDRAGCALLISLINSDLTYDAFFSFTVQEENGCIGAVTAGYTADPDIAVAIETTTASDIAGVSPDNVVCRLGGGPVVSFMDKGTVYDHGLYKLATQAARERGIPVQAKEGVYGGNESRSLQSAKSGARTLAVSLPCRYIHSPYCMLRESDIGHTRELLLAFLEAAANIPKG